jgi:hypothetical protein
VNLSEAPASSVHVYSPPLSSMMFYDPAGTPCRFERVDPETPVWSTEPFSTASLGSPPPRFARQGLDSAGSGTLAGGGTPPSASLAE